LVFIWSLSANAQTKSAEVPIVVLPAEAADFFLQKYYTGVRDSIRFKNAQADKQNLLDAIAIKSRQCESCELSLVKKDSVISLLVSEKKLAIDSAEVKCAEKVDSVKKGNKIRNWIIVVLATYGLAKTL
jgi:hypothetical protein